eukprot:gene22690-30972_t
MSELINEADSKAALPNTKKNPTEFLKQVIGKSVVVRLNSGVTYRGVLACLDGFMNIAMEQTEEYYEGQLKNRYGDCFIRGNNVYCQVSHNKLRNRINSGIVDSGTTIDVSSPEFKSLAAQTYAKVLPCILDSWMMKDRKRKDSDFQFPEDAQFHYERIKNITASYRYAPVHEYAGYEGPWIENIFITKFIDRPLHTYGGLIPIFVQWIDNQILRGKYFDYIHAELNDILRPSVLYVAISQGDVGLGKIGRSHPNILVLAAGGYGHVPLPLIKGEIAYSAIPFTSSMSSLTLNQAKQLQQAHAGLPSIQSVDIWSNVKFQFGQDIGFFGSTGVMQQSRNQMLAIIKGEAERQNLTYKQGSGSSWKQDMEQTKFNLAPRGYGRNSFRFAESIQLGRIPVFLYTDLPWIPYQNSSISVETYGFSAGLTSSENTLVSMVQQLRKVTDKELMHKLQILKEVRFYFTYAGVVQQIEKFFEDPFGPGGGYLRCTKHPREERCCG